MKLESSRLLPVSQELVWQSLNDVDVLRSCIPGCESLDRTEDGTLEATVVARVGPVGARFKGKVVLEDIIAPTSYRLVFTGQGGAAGFAKGEANVALSSQPNNTTELRYSTDASVGGKLAQVGARLIESSARKLAEDFFSRFEKAITAAANEDRESPDQNGEAAPIADSQPRNATAGQANPSVVKAAPNHKPSTEEKTSGQNAMIWRIVAGAALVITVAAYLYYK